MNFIVCQFFKYNEFVKVCPLVLSQHCKYCIVFSLNNEINLLTIEIKVTDETLVCRVFTAKNNVILPNFLVWKFCGKAQFPQSFRRFAHNIVETTFQQNFHSRKFDDITVSYAVFKRT